MPWLLTTCLVGAVGVFALAWACYVVFAPSPHVLTGEPDGDASWVHAWSEPPQASDAALAIDGRRGGTLPYAWQASRRATLHLESQRTIELVGAVVSWQGRPPSAATMHIGSRSVPLKAADAQAESVLWLGAPQAVSRVSLDVQDAAVAELQLLPEAAVVWLLAPRERADLDLELLATYGATQVARAPIAGAALSHARAIVVSNTPVPDLEAAQLRQYVEAGATLVELGPSSAICSAALVGEDAPAPSFALEGQTGEGARWPIALARLPDCHDTSCQNDEVLVAARSGDSHAVRPVVVSRALGAGHCIRWLGDLSLAIRTLRQGDPARAGAALPADHAFKPSDLFDAGSVNDVPSADRLGFALARQLTAAEGMDLVVAPLPAAGAGLVVYTSDQDFVPGAGELARSESARELGMTLTLTAADIGGKPDITYPEASEPVLQRSQVEQLAERGHSVGIHPNLVGVDAEQYAQVIDAHVQRFRERYGAAPRIVRNHHLIWQGFTTMAETLARAGLQLDLSYASIPAGFMTGSGLPMRFVDSAGQLVPIFQQATQFEDSAFIPEDPATFETTTQRLSERLAELLSIAQREHIPLTVLHHSHWWFRSAGRLQAALIAEAHKRDLKVWGAAEWLRFTYARRSTLIRRKGVGYEVDVSADQLALLIEGTGRVRVNGSPRELQSWRDTTGPYLVLPLERGRYLIEP